MERQIQETIQITAHQKKLAFKNFYDTIEALEEYIEKIGCYPDFKNKKQIFKESINDPNRTPDELADDFLTFLFLFKSMVNNKPDYFRKEIKEEYYKWINAVGIDANNCPDERLKHFLFEINEILEGKGENFVEQTRKSINDGKEIDPKDMLKVFGAIQPHLNKNREDGKLLERKTDKDIEIESKFSGNSEQGKESFKQIAKTLSNHENFSFYRYKQRKAIEEIDKNRGEWEIREVFKRRVKKSSLIRLGRKYLGLGDWEEKDSRIVVVHKELEVKYDDSGFLQFCYGKMHYRDYFNGEEWNEIQQILNGSQNDGEAMEMDETSNKVNKEENIQQTIDLIKMDDDKDDKMEVDDSRGNVENQNSCFSNQAGISFSSQSTDPQQITSSEIIKDVKVNPQNWTLDEIATEINDFDGEKKQEWLLIRRDARLDEYNQERKLNFNNNPIYLWENFNSQQRFEIKLAKSLSSGYLTDGEIKWVIREFKENPRIWRIGVDKGQTYLIHNSAQGNDEKEWGTLIHNRQKFSETEWTEINGTLGEISTANQSIRWELVNKINQQKNRFKVEKVVVFNEEIGDFEEESWIIHDLAERKDDGGGGLVFDADKMVKVKDLTEAEKRTISYESQKSLQNFYSVSIPQDQKSSSLDISKILVVIGVVSMTVITGVVLIRKKLNKEEKSKKVLGQT